MNEQERLDKISACVDGEMSGEEREAFDSLLAEDDALRAEVDALRRLERMLGAAPRPSAPPGFAAQVMRRAREEGGARVVDAAGPLSDAFGADSSPDRFNYRQSFYLLAKMAAGVAVLIGVGFAIYQVRRPAGPDKSQIALADSSPKTTEAEETPFALAMAEPPARMDFAARAGSSPKDASQSPPEAAHEPEAAPPDSAREMASAPETETESKQTPAPPGQSVAVAESRELAAAPAEADREDKLLKQAATKPPREIALASPGTDNETSWLDQWNGEPPETDGQVATLAMNAAPPEPPAPAAEAPLESASAALAPMAPAVDDGFISPESPAAPAEMNAETALAAADGTGMNAVPMTNFRSVPAPPASAIEAVGGMEKKEEAVSAESPSVELAAATTEPTPLPPHLQPTPKPASVAIQLTAPEEPASTAVAERGRNAGSAASGMVNQFEVYGAGGAASAARAGQDAQPMEFSSSMPEAGRSDGGAPRVVNQRIMQPRQTGGRGGAGAMNAVEDSPLPVQDLPNELPGAVVSPRALSPVPPTPAPAVERPQITSDARVAMAVYRQSSESDDRALTRAETTVRAAVAAVKGEVLAVKTTRPLEGAPYKELIVRLPAADARRLPERLTRDGYAYRDALNGTKLDSAMGQKLLPPRTPGASGVAYFEQPAPQAGGGAGARKAAGGLLDALTQLADAKPGESAVKSLAAPSPASAASGDQLTLTIHIIAAD